MAPEFSVPTPIYGIGPSRFSWMCGTPSGSRAGRARRAGHIPWAVTLAVYPGHTLVCGRAQMEAAARQAHGVTQPGRIALTGTRRRPTPPPVPARAHVLAHHTASRMVG